MAPILLERPIPELPHISAKSPKCSQSICACKDVVELDLGHCWSRPQETRALTSILDTDRLKAAWILTLRRFRPEDVTTLSYEDDSTRGFKSPTIFTVRVGPDWDVRKLLETLEVENAGRVSSKSHGPQIAKHGRSETSCTSLIYTTTPGLCLARSSPGSEDLKFAVIQHDNRTVARIENSRTGGSSLNTSMLWTLQHVLRQLTVESVTLKLDEIDYCSEFHRQLLKDLTHPRSPGSFHCLHDLIVENCRRHPTRTAVRSFDGDLTYQELNNLSLRLAHHLTSLGVQPESFVLSSFQKSTWAIVARLAILRAGGAYISIHSSNPPAYLDSVIQRTNAKIMLSDPGYADHFRDKIDTVVTVTPEWLQTLPLEPASSSLPVVDPSNACTVLFTSGSTGKPKAIVQEHKSYASAIHDYARNLGLNQDTRFLHFDDYAFDISNLEFLVPLILGGCCCVPGPMKLVQDLADNIQSLNANIAFLTPTVAIKANPEAMSSLKILCVGGEPLPKDLLNNWAHSSTKLINQYGMGEAAVCCAYNDNVHATSSAPATIGRPSSGAIWLIDPTCPEKLVPVGAIGEVVIEGPHLARGYLDQNHQASDRTKPAGFLESIPRWLTELHPDRQSARLYRSGDLARYTQDGLIEYIGRKDTIVKLDGCRIDVVEVEHLARKCLTPKDAIVVDLLGVIDGKQSPCLAAFLYLSDHPDSSETGDLSLKDASQDQSAFQKVDQIRNSLAVFLPTYMIPSLFLLGTRVPRTPSKKTDRRMIRLVSHQFYAQMCEERSSSSSEDSDLLPP